MFATLRFNASDFAQTNTCGSTLAIDGSRQVHVITSTAAIAPSQHSCNEHKERELQENKSTGGEGGIRMIPFGAQ